MQSKIVHSDEKFSIYPQCDDKYCEDIIYESCDSSRHEINVRKKTQYISPQSEVVNWLINSFEDKDEREKNISFLRTKIKEKHKNCSLIKLLSSNTYYIIVNQSCLDYASRKTCA